MPHLTSDTSDALLTLLSLLSVGEMGTGDTEEEEVGQRVSPTWRQRHFNMRHNNDVEILP